MFRLKAKFTTKLHETIALIIKQDRFTTKGIKF